MKAVLVVGLGLLLLLGGCVAWNETAISRAEERLRRIVRPGMTAVDAEAALRGMGAHVWPTTRGPQGFSATIEDIQNVYIGTASLHVIVRFDADGRVAGFQTSVTTSCL